MIRMKTKAVFSGLSCASRIENVVETSEMVRLRRISNLRNEIPILTMNVDAHQTSFVIDRPLNISSILGIGYLPKITYAVIAWIPVDMIDLIRRPFTVVDKPRESMRLMDLPKNAYPDISVLPYMPNNISGLPSFKRRPKLIAPSALGPGENTCFWVVMKEFFKLFLSEHNGTFSQKAVGRMRQPLTRWFSGCIPSRTYSLSTFSQQAKPAQDAEIV